MKNSRGTMNGIVSLAKFFFTGTVVGLNPFDPVCSVAHSLMISVVDNPKQSTSCAIQSPEDFLFFLFFGVGLYPLRGCLIHRDVFLI